MEAFDLIVLGGGPAGYLGAARAAAGGLKTAVVEKRALGGVCLNEGCIPTKTLLHSAKIYEYAGHGEKYGVTAENVKLDHAAVLARKNKVVRMLVSGVGAKLKAGGVRVVGGEGAVRGKTGGGFLVEAGGGEFAAERLLVATGSVPVLPPVPGLKEGLESGFALTSRGILDIKNVPGRLTVVGGGVIGLEMAAYFAAAGSKVTVVEMLDKVAGPFETEISGILLKNLQKKGIEFRLGCKVTGIGDGRVAFEEKGSAQSVGADAVLLSVGRRAFTEGTGLDLLGVRMERGAVVTDGHMRTNVPGVYAAGDVNGKSMLAHTAFREAEVAVNHMLGAQDEMRYGAVPSVIYTNPEAAGVGETEESAAEKGIDARCVRLSMRYSGRYLAEVEGGDGIVKLIADRKTNRLLGAHMIGSYVSEIIYGAAMMIDSGMEIERLRRFVFPHPTVSEIIREALFEF